ncbi:MAG: precorrin-3B C(17)-methyltransferase, partial [Clostridia bacterium]|nr:precorrin-3B C(17)-methyltransferase [Clostridia bacterium]
MNKLYVVGLGPGSFEDMTLRAHRALEEAEVIIGYHVYVDLVRGHYPGKEFLTTPMTREAERCRMALDEAKKGRKAALVCSGDSGIYGMAGLVLELRGEDPEPEVIMIPGLTAACSGGALLGVPLTHDFCVVSLSDRLTEWGLIERRLTAAADADLTLVLYNPASRGRPEHLKKA